MQDQSNDARQRRAAAFHEAGHAVVVGHWPDYEVYKHDVGADGLGKVRFTHPPTEHESTEGKFRLLTVEVAGKLAEEIAGFVPAGAAWESALEGVRLVLDSEGVSERDLLVEHDHSDGVMAGLLLRGMSAQEAERELRSAHGAARGILDEQWADVETMAAQMAGAE
jgi:ATP-dependent Zn protease